MNTRDQIIRCGLRELERTGLNAFSVRATGAAAGLSAMAMYRHFKNNDDLLRAIGEDAFAVYHQRISAIQEPSLVRYFQKVARAYVEFSLDDPGRFEACFVFKTQVERIYPRDFREGKSPVIALMVARLREAQTQGLIAPVDPVEAALLLWAQVHGIVMLYRAGRMSLPRAAYLRLVQNSTTRFLRSFESMPAAPRRKNKTQKTNQ
ncbi:MAG TPA: TetR/AcrR family transcriptional regulator [Opitutaceae bacterium]